MVTLRITYSDDSVAQPVNSRDQIDFMSIHTAMWDKCSVKHHL